jgi:hypothetical protein
MTHALESDGVNRSIAAVNLRLNVVKVDAVASIHVIASLQGDVADWMAAGLNDSRTSHVLAGRGIFACQ